MKEFLNRLGLSLIILTYLSMVSALYEQINPFLIFFGLLCSGWRIAHFYGRVPLLGRLWLNFITIASSLVTVIIVYPLGLFSIMLHLIMLGFSLKFLELKSIRDVHFFVNTGFVLVALFFIFNYSIAMTLVAGLLILLLLAVLLSVHGGHLAGNRFIKLLLKSCLLSLPLALVLFVVIPRLPSLWKMPLQKYATTGLSDTVSPGQIAELSRSSALAFRASFVGEPVRQSERYWRVMTLDNFDGQTWSQSLSKKNQEQQAKTGSSVSFQLSTKKNSIDLIIEPHYNYWIPTLDYGKADLGQVSLSDYALRSTKPVVKRDHFEVDLYQQIETKPLTTVEKQQLLSLPTQGNLETQDWVATKVKQGLDKQAILKQLLNDFSTKNFRYTLKPPPLGIDQVDDFLFSTQAGFCVHYASSYLYVARLLGVPARMVTGYLGGEWQAQDQFMSIRQYDAHAWVEIWQENKWLRIDPTAYVAPERVELGLEQSLSNRDEFLADEYFSLQKWRNIRLLNKLRTKIAQIDYLWATWVINYDNKKQLRLLQSWFVNVPWLNLFSAVLMIMLLVFSSVFLIIFKPWIRQKINAEDKLYIKLQRYYSKKGLRRLKGQTVTDFCQLASTKSSHPSALFESFSSKYNSLKYDVNLSASERKKRLKQLRFICKQLQKG
ncbi:transglutaminase domain protein [Psychromonas ingrahamii 37]|uniref:Transglutaminase domain protein n=1 Tax=Psychromonas ingrahamii (strain DSM 17664 / CCUG 51855 / 37) TaxID=357804 RepID=A1SX90_PSYIN|nr:DUF3488 and transglutaminase-like domain-containing protein [Psychromonas ingrahamii]ABM04105.1 transglutaminase domain protein [Psychromonas ingrahamii 37]